MMAQLDLFKDVPLPALTGDKAIVARALLSGRTKHWPPFWREIIETKRMQTGLDAVVLMFDGVVGRFHIDKWLTGLNMVEETEIDGKIVMRRKYVPIDDAWSVTGLLPHQKPYC